MKNYLFLFFAIAAIHLHAQDSDFDKLMQQDWANLGKYQADNEKTMKDNYDDLVVFMGNSITEGWVMNSPQFFTTNNFIGRGISGQTTPQMLIRFTPDVLDLQPEAVVILAGTNDIAGNTGASTVKMITDNIKAMAQLAATNNIRVVLASVLPVYKYPWRPQIEPIDKILQVNNWMKAYAAATGHTYLDFYSAMVDERKGLKAAYSEDGVHPNRKGYAVMEPLALKAIAKTRQD